MGETLDRHGRLGFGDAGSFIVAAGASKMDFIGDGFFRFKSGSDFVHESDGDD